MKKARRILALALSLMLLLSATSLIGAAEAETTAGMGRVIDGYDPIPLLIIKINCDADGDGKDCYEEIHEENVYDDKGNVLYYAGERKYAYTRWKNKDSDKYGEQFCYSPDDYWAELCFGEGFGSLNDYYKYISNDRFYWIPAEETSGTPNDGVITVTVNEVHPGSNTGGDLGDGPERGKALKAADEFVDFSKFDKNGDGKIEFTELSVVFIYGGAEISYNATTSAQYSFPTHAHVSHMSYQTKQDGVTLWSDLPYVRMGEYSGGSGDRKWSKMGKLAHELGHVLNAKDLYTNSEGWIGGCGELSLMGGGSGGSNNGISSPTVLDPYYKVLYGFADETVAKSGTNEYTLYSHESTKGEFNVIRVNLPNSNEYLLIENRSHSTSGYDNNNLNEDKNGNSMQGILIWHIDQTVVNGYARPNNASEGHAAGFTVITPTNNIQDVDASSTWSKDSASNVFVASNEAQYKFPKSSADDANATWHTSLTEEQAAECNIKIEFLTSAGNEMTIRITGAYDLAPEFAGAASETTQTTLSLKAGITDYNGAEILACKMRISESKSLTDAKEITVEKNENGEYIGTFEGLTEDTEYYFAIVLETTHGTVEKLSSTYTLPKPVEKTEAKITAHINGDRGATITVKTKLGSAITISNNYLVKKGYTLEGWYLDADFTQPYDITKPLESTDDFAIYAKWKQNAVQTTAPTTEAPADTGDNGGNGGDAGKGGCGSSIAPVAIVSASVLGLGVGFIRKKKEQ